MACHVDPGLQHPLHLKAVGDGNDNRRHFLRVAIRGEQPGGLPFPQRLGERVARKSRYLPTKKSWAGWAGSLAAAESVAWSWTRPGTSALCRMIGAQGGERIAAGGMLPVEVVLVALFQDGRQQVFLGVEVVHQAPAGSGCTNERPRAMRCLGSLPGKRSPGPCAGFPRAWQRLWGTGLSLTCLRSYNTVDPASSTLVQQNRSLYGFAIAPSWRPPRGQDPMRTPRAADARDHLSDRTIALVAARLIRPRTRPRQGAADAAPRSAVPDNGRRRWQWVAAAVLPWPSSC